MIDGPNMTSGSDSSSLKPSPQLAANRLPDRAFGDRTASLFSASASFAAAALTMIAPGTAFAQASPLSIGLVDPPANDRLGSMRYATPDGGVRFVLDRSPGRTALFRYEGDDEVMVLRPAAGPRGDELYKTEQGEVLVRVTALGSVTLFRGRGALGMPAEPLGDATPLAPPQWPVATQQARLKELARLTVRTMGRPIAFETPKTGAAGGLVVDAATRAAQGLAAAPGPNVQRVVIVFGDKPQARVQPDGALQVMVAPTMGYAGRPSALAVRTALTTTSPASGQR
jgi:hypothetical protein